MRHRHPHRATKLLPCVAVLLAAPLTTAAYGPGEHSHDPPRPAVRAQVRDGLSLLAPGALHIEASNGDKPADRHAGDTHRPPHRDHDRHRDPATPSDDPPSDDPSSRESGNDTKSSSNSASDSASHGRGAHDESDEPAGSSDRPHRSQGSAQPERSAAPVQPHRHGQPSPYGQRDGSTPGRSGEGPGGSSGRDGGDGSDSGADGGAGRHGDGRGGDGAGSRGNGNDDADGTFGTQNLYEPDPAESDPEGNAEARAVGTPTTAAAGEASPVLPLGAGLTLIGLGLAFLALRLRRG